MYTFELEEVIIFEDSGSVWKARIRRLVSKAKTCVSVDGSVVNEIVLFIRIHNDWYDDNDLLKRKEIFQFVTPIIF